MSFNPFCLKLFLVLAVAINLAAHPVFGAGIYPDRVVELANNDRVGLGLNPLKESPQLNLAAAAKAQEILSHDRFDHYMPDGHTPWDFILASGYDFAYAGENLALGWQTAESQQLAWMNSPTHRANILNPIYQDVGVSVVEVNLEGRQSTLVVQMFGITRGALAAQFDGLSTYLAKLLGV